MFLSACVGVGLNQDEIFNLTNAMIKSGQQLSWPNQLVVDKHWCGECQAIERH